MSGRYWAGEWPNLNSISIALDDSALLSAAEIGVLYRLVWFIASQSVNSAYSDPSPAPGLPDDDRVIARIARCSESEWASVRDVVLANFVMKGGKWRLRDHSVIRLTREANRSALPVDVRAQVLKRDGERCVYCGDAEGPFHFDHLWPVAKGGSDDANNLVLACAPCNLAKRDKTLLEWVTKGRSGDGTNS